MLNSKKSPKFHGENPPLQELPIVHDLAQAQFDQVVTFYDFLLSPSL